PGDVGVEFTADGKFYILKRDNKGAIVRGVGLDSEGTWNVNLADSFSPAVNGFGIDLHQSVGMNQPTVYFEENPLRLRLSSFGKEDRKSTRLNSSHQIISYAVFCLKKIKLVVCSSRGVISSDVCSE